MISATFLDGFKNKTFILTERILVFLMLLSGAVIALAPKGLTALVVLLALFSAVNLWAKGQKISLALNGATYSLAAFFIWVGLSVFWADDMAQASKKFAQLTALMLCLPPLFCLANQNNLLRKRHIRLAIFISFVIAWTITCLIVFLPIEFQTNLSEVNKYLLAHDLAHIQLGNYKSLSNRAITILLPLTLLACSFFSNPSQRLIFLAIIFYIITQSTNQSALLAVILMFAFIGASYFLHITKIRLFIVTSTLAAMLIVPLSLLNFKHDISVSLLPQKFLKAATVQSRTDLYYSYSKAIFENPIFGKGLDTSSSVQLGDKDYNFYHVKHPPHHPHNYFLQVIYELGLVGLGLFLLLLINIAKQIDNNYHPLQSTFLWLSFIGAISISFFAYNLWQSWLMANFIFLFFTFCSARKIEAQ